MREMKDSGVPWIGMFPKGWNLMKGRYCYDILSGFPFASDRFSNSSGYPLIRIRDITSGTVETFFDGDYPVEYVIKSGDLLVGMDGDFNIRLWSSVDALLNQRCCKITEKSQYDRRWLYYVLPFNLELINSLAYSTTVKHLSVPDLKETDIPAPSLLAQQRIANFLDTKCAEIDSILEKTKTSIEEYKKLKQSVITEAVTKGIRGERPMKDSGVEWIGETPADWEVYPLKHLFVRRSQKNNPIVSTERLSLSIDVGITKYADKTTNLDRFKDDFSQYQLAYPDDIVLNSMNMIVGAVGKSPFFGCVSPVYYVIYPRSSADVGYWSYLLNCMKIRDVYHSLGQGIYAIERGEGRVNTCRLKVPYDDFGRIMVSTPSYEEQQEIAAYLDEKCAAIDSLIASKEALITELEAYKKSLIYEYVTGKKEVM